MRASVCLAKVTLDLLDWLSPIMISVGTLLCMQAEQNHLPAWSCVGTGRDPNAFNWRMHIVSLMNGGIELDATASEFRREAILQVSRSPVPAVETPLASK